MAPPEALAASPDRDPSDSSKAQQVTGEQLRDTSNVRTSNTEPLPLGGFRLTVEGTFRVFRPSFRAGNIRLTLSGQWNVFPLSLTRQTKIAGTVTVEGLVRDALIDGVLDVTLLPKLPFRLEINFADSKGQRHSIKAETRRLLNALARHASVNGTLLRGETEVGTVNLLVDWSLLKKALPSIA